MGLPVSLVRACWRRCDGAESRAHFPPFFLFFDLFTSVLVFLCFLGVCSFIHFYFVLLLSPFGSDLSKWLISPFLVVTWKNLDNIYFVLGELS